MDNKSKSADSKMDNKSKSADSKMDNKSKSADSKMDHMPDDEPSSIDKTHGKVKNKPEDKLKSDNQPEQPKSAVKFSDKTEQPKSAVKLNDQTEQPKSAVKLNDQTEQPKSAVKLNDQTEQPKSAEELNDQTEQPKSADKLVGKVDEKPKSEKEKDTATTDKWRAESQGTKPESEAPGRGVVEGEGNEVDDVTLEEEGDEEEDGGLNKSDKSGGQPFNPQPQEESSHFFAYLVCMALLVAVLYVGYHNKRKIIAFVLEGRRSKASRRPKTADYQKLDQHVSSHMSTHGHHNNFTP
uniref:Trans-golgi network protein 2 n=1 Tax=Electrophorus electricus TaxID=8005 RepID=A0AAY5EUF3_ELEEL